MHRDTGERSRDTLIIGLATSMLLVACPRAFANDAEIISLVGKGDARETADAAWRPASVRQKLQAGAFVRTGEMSQMGLLLRDRTQVRLNQLSILNIKTVNLAEPPPPTRLELPQGRAWSQAKPRSPDLARKAPALEVSMPGGTALIRGTDWELVVDRDGTSTVTVLSGEIEFFNDLGRVSLLQNEQARARPGSAPVKILLASSAERVQWVTAYRPQPRRWVPNPGPLEPAVRSIEGQDYPQALAALSISRDPRAALLRADLHMYFGEPAQAARLAGLSADVDPTAASLLVRAFIAEGRLPAAEWALWNARRAFPDHPEVLLASAELARVKGDAKAMRDAAHQVIAREPGNAEGWYAIGRLETEREFVAAARDALRRALAINPHGAGYRGELGTLETFANELEAAQAALEAALEAQPDDYVALTGLGVLQLKQGRPRPALESFLKAGLMEPRYARASLFSAIAYSQLGEKQRALEALDRAAALDEKDPLPHLVRTLLYYDALELGPAIDAAREAQSRMPNLKSLNQVLSDQRGSANLGSALAAFGMEEWAQAAAYDSYSPYWSGSHLFLADRMQGSYSRNSELFKGFLSDPAVFGASNRHSSIVTVPGHYGSVSVTAARDYIEERGIGASINGYSVAVRPFSYFASVDRTLGDSRINRVDADGTMRAAGETAVIGLGLRPVHELGLFAFGTRSSYGGRIAEQLSGLTDEDFEFDYRRYDVGANFRINPTNHVWLKLGHGTEAVPVSGALLSQRTADTLNAGLGPLLGVTFQPLGALDRFHYDLVQRDAQFRHTLDASSGVQLTWGVERASESKPLVTVVTFAPLQIGLEQTNRLESDGAYVSGRFRVADAIEVQADLHHQDFLSSFHNTSFFRLNNGAPVALPPAAGATRRREINPRFGLKWSLAPFHTLRAAVQSWRRPPGVNTLAPVDTVGIALDDRIERAGGKLERGRLQQDMALSERTFLQLFADTKRVANLETAGAGIVPDLNLEQLETLRNRRRVYGIEQDYLEAAPDFSAGRASLAGGAVNHLATTRTAASARYVYARTKNSSAAFNGLPLPFHPRHYLNLAVNWQPYPRWVVGASGTYRTRRSADEGGTTMLENGWTAGLQAYWESEDKRLSLAGVIEHIRSRSGASYYRSPAAHVQAIYRF